MTERTKATTHLGSQDRPDSDKLITAYERDCKLQRLANVTITTRGYTLRNFARFLKGQKVHNLDIGREDIRGWVEEYRINRGRTTESTKNNLTIISGFYDYLTFESLIDTNPVPVVRKRYLNSYKEGNECHSHKIISVEEMAALIRSAVDIRDRCLMLLMVKTGVRRGELIAMDVTDINFADNRILLKPTPKRSNRLVYFDDEAEALLRRWLKVRQSRNKRNDPALFISQRSIRLEKNGIDKII